MCMGALGFITARRTHANVPNLSLLYITVSFTVAKDLRPQWRRMIWNSEGTLLAVAMR